jgi:hypothetical protein
MYRVELKVLSGNIYSFNIYVPNVPCGVERLRLLLTYPKAYPHVPNVPCGVESACNLCKHSEVFLMYRVELKGSSMFSKKSCKVPNVPCGVERIESTCKHLMCS